MLREKIIPRLALTFTTLVASGCGAVEATKKSDAQREDGSRTPITAPALENPHIIQVVIPYGSEPQLATSPETPSEQNIIILPYGSEINHQPNKEEDLIVIRNIGNKTPQELEAGLKFYLKDKGQQDQRRFYFVNRQNDIAFVVSLKQEDINSRLPDEKYPPKPLPMTLTFWNGIQRVIEIPDNVWQDAFDACAWVNGGVYDPQVCSAPKLLGIRITENDLNNPVARQPSSNACGPYQFMDGTWVMYDPGFGNCLDERASAFAAAKMTVVLNLHQQPTEEDFIRRFAGLDGGLVWNQHIGQAETVWEINEKLESWLNNPDPSKVSTFTPSFENQMPPSSRSNEHNSLYNYYTIERLPSTCPDCITLTFDTELPDCTYFQLPQDKQNCYGPETYLSQLLDILDQEGVKATFFIQGKWAEAYLELVKEIAKRGHLIANHGQSHPYYSKISPEERVADIMAGRETIEKAGLEVSDFFRLPYGDGWWRHTLDIGVQTDVRSTGFYSVGWSLDSGDWKGLPAGEIASNVTEAEGGSIVLFHPHSPHLAEALKIVIPELKNRGFKFVTLEEDRETIPKEQIIIGSIPNLAGQEGIKLSNPSPLNEFPESGREQILDLGRGVTFVNRSSQPDFPLGNVFTADFVRQVVEIDDSVAIEFIGVDFIPMSRGGGAPAMYIPPLEHLPSWQIQNWQGVGKEQFPEKGKAKILVNIPYMVEDRTYNQNSLDPFLGYTAYELTHGKLIVEDFPLSYDEALVSQKAREKLAELGLWGN